MFISEKQVRKTILAQIDTLEKQRCDKCNTQSAGINCKCKAAVEIRKLGKKFEAISAVKRKARIKELLSTLTYESINLETYGALKCLEITDREITQRSKINPIELHHWRFLNGMTKNPPRTAAVKKKPETEYEKWRSVAKANGISTGTFSRRVRNEQISLEEAATRPLVRGRVAAK